MSWYTQKHEFDPPYKYNAFSMGEAQASAVQYSKADAAHILTPFVSGKSGIFIDDPALPMVGAKVEPTTPGSNRTAAYAALPFGTVIRGADSGWPVIQKMPGAPDAILPWLRFECQPHSWCFASWWGNHSHTNYRVAAYLENPFELYSVHDVDPNPTLDWLHQKYPGFAASLSGVSKPGPAPYVWRDDEYVIAHNTKFKALPTSSKVHRFFVHWDGVPCVYRDGPGEYNGMKGAPKKWERVAFTAFLQLERIARLEPGGHLDAFEDIVYG